MLPIVYCGGGWFVALRTTVVHAAAADDDDVTKQHALITGSWLVDKNKNNVKTHTKVT